MSRTLDQSWIEGWQDGPWERVESEILWLRSHNESLHALILRFPPRCIVKANRLLKCPAPGTCGIVVGYFIPSKKWPDGALSVRQAPTSALRYKCRPGWLEVTGYYRGLSPSVVSAIIHEPASM